MLPIIGLRVPRALFMIGVLLLVLVPVGGGGLWVSNQPIFCNSCHEMSMHYATWSQSAHAGVECEECHLMPGTLNMFKSKLVALRQVRLHAAGDVKASIIRGKVPDENCRHCHAETRELITYHGLKITHLEHWKMGLECTFCHDRVAHGPRWQFEGVSSAEEFTQVATPSKYAPTMELCYTCHDGKQASNKCSTCHVTLGERRSRTFDPAWVAAHREEVRHRGELDCQRCHQNTFCDRCHREANPHARGWTSRHPKDAASDPERCLTCHLVPGEDKPQQVSELAFCRACHSLQREHQGLDWGQRHGKEALEDRVSCQRCHEQSWCADCHAISRPHPEEWRIRHSAEASREKEGCQVCHPSDFCEACHRGKKGVPESHEGPWLARHKEEAREREKSCQVCHEPDFCHACHDKHTPEDHHTGWSSKHGAASIRKDSACLICHERRDCQACHGMVMPHPEDWLEEHFTAAAKDEALCQRCHRKEACAVCHRGALPSSHKQPDWSSRHGASAEESPEKCALCHRATLCSSCHGAEMPHPEGWKRGPHGAAAEKDAAACLRCHTKQECQACHGLEMPHPASWITQHGAQAASSASQCAVCHGPGLHDCGTCHSALAPADHGEEHWTEKHGEVGATSIDLCNLCHGENACVDCHANMTDED
ncbi:MAG: hypothetical protein GTN69_05080 [Armatimonadetes bacterium]|nr:hypothetical protein [Armatimonadota bacterium]NIO75256.1 hypothetical protein [Armatimonadota bacterium]